MDQKGFANAIKVAANMVTHKFIEKVSAQIKDHQNEQKLESDAA